MFEVDLTTVTGVMIIGEWVKVCPGTFVVGFPTFHARGAVTFRGELPLSFFFVDDDGDNRTGPYTLIQQLVYTPADKRRETGA